MDWRLYNKSCLDMSEVSDESVALMVTSPPYNVGKEYESAGMSQYAYEEMLRVVMRETYRTLAPGGRAAVNIGGTNRSPYYPNFYHVIGAAFDAGFQMRDMIVWDKGMVGVSTAWGSWRRPSSPTMQDIHEFIMVFQKPPFMRRSKRGDYTTTPDEFVQWRKSIWQMSPESAKRVGHDAPFPIELPRRLIRLHTSIGDLVLDPFTGSGTSGVAALQEHRMFVGYEIDEQLGYCDIARKRMEEALRERIALIPYSDKVLGSDPICPACGGRVRKAMRRRTSWSRGSLQRFCNPTCRNRYHVRQSWRRGRGERSETP